MIRSKKMTWIGPLFAVALMLAMVAPAVAAELLVVSTTSLAAGEEDIVYSQTLEATGGVEPYSWSISPGTLPDGLTLSDTGVIAGTPTTAGRSEFTVEVTDSESTVASQALSITIAAPVAVATTALANGTLGAAYEQHLAAGGGVAPFSWSLSVGTLPDGLTLNADTGVIAGTPTLASSSTFTVDVTDALGATASGDLSITVDAVTALSITTTELPNATTGVEYATTLAASGGVAPLTWSLIAGSLPAGLALDGATGTVAGTPTTKGSTLFAVRVTDATGAIAARIYMLTVKQGEKPAPELDAKVLAACKDALNVHPAMSALCRIYSSEQVGSPARQVIGRLILKFADADHARARKDAKEHKDGSRAVSAPVKARSDATDGVKIKVASKSNSGKSSAGFHEKD